jgi:hypothetical protein
MGTGAGDDAELGAAERAMVAVTTEADGSGSDAANDEPPLGSDAATAGLPFDAGAEGTVEVGVLAAATTCRVTVVCLVTVWALPTVISPKATTASAVRVSEAVRTTFHRRVDAPRASGDEADSELLMRHRRWWL